MIHKPLHISAKQRLEDESSEAGKTLFGDTALLANLGLPTLQDVMQAKLGKAVRTTPLRQTFELFSANKTERFFLKRYLPKRTFSRAHLSQSHEERKAFERMAQLKVPTPKLVAWGGDRKTGAFLLWRACEGEPLDQTLHESYPDPLRLGLYRAKKLWIESAASFVGLLHDRGYVHRDLYAGHILYAGVEGRALQFFLIDLQRVCRKKLRRWYVKDLAALHFSTPKTVSQADRLRFLLHRLGKQKLDRSVKRWVHSISKKAKKIAAHRPKYG